LPATFLFSIRAYSYYDRNVTVTLGPGFNFAGTATTGFHVRAEGTPPEMEIYTRTLGNKQFELKDHLGNVRAVVSDVKLSTLVNNVPQNYEPKLLALNNYYPFGMDQPERMWNASGKYRYGFNGKEKDDNGEWGNTAYDYGFRIYSPNISKFLSVDPLTKSYPELTPYQFASNRPVDGIDLDGLEYYSVHLQVITTNSGRSHLKTIRIEDHTKMTEDQFIRIHENSRKVDFDRFSVSFGKKGPGVEYVFHNNQGVIDQRFRADDISRYGIWYGKGSATDVRFKNLGNVRIGDMINPIDEVDFIAKLHDLEQSDKDFKSHKESRWLESDINFVARLELYIDRASDKNFRDEFTGRKASKVALNRAKNAVKYFMGEFTGPIGAIAGQGEISPKAEDRGYTMDGIRKEVNRIKEKMTDEKRKY
jgi:RHS repeat-associated protein